MTEIKVGSVVVGVDGSAHSDAAAIWAAAYAAIANRPLMVVNAMAPLSPIERMTGAREARQMLRTASARVIDEAVALARRTAPDLDIDTSAPVGDAREVMIDVSDRAAIIVVGTRGHGPVASLLLGSVSVAVASHARCAVAVVRPREEPATGVVVGVASDRPDSVAIEFAAGLASAQGCALDVVHAWRSGDVVVDRLSDESRLDSMHQHERALAEAISGLAEKFPDIQVNRHMPEQRPVDALVERSTAADCVVLGSGGRVGARALLGSVSRAVIEHAHSTVVVVRG